MFDGHISGGRALPINLTFMAVYLLNLLDIFLSCFLGDNFKKQVRM